MSKWRMIVPRATSGATVRILPAVSVCIAFQTACAREPEPAPAAAEDTAAPVQSDSVSQPPAGAELPPGATEAERCAAYVQDGLTLHAANRAEIRRALGAPDTVDVSTEPNRHVLESTDSLLTIVYAGVSFRLRRPGPGGELIENVTVRDNKYLRFAPGTGASEAAVLEALGEPAARAEDELIYACGTGAVDDPVTFRLANGNVAEIVFAYYVD